MPHTTVARTRAVAAATLLTLMLSLFAAGTARAQFLPAVFYGTGLEAGQTVAVYINAKFCSSTVVNDSGEWILQVAADAACGPADGVPVTFVVNEQVMTAEPPATWQSGGIPAGSIATGYTLTPGDGMIPAPSGEVTGTPGAEGTGSATRTPGAGGSGSTATGIPTAGGSEDTADDEGGSNTAVFAGIGAVVLAAAAAGGFFLYRRNAGA